MSPLLKKMLIVLGAIVALLIVIAVVVPASDEEPEPPAVQAEPEPSGIRLVASESSCEADAFDAKILFLITLENTGDTASEVDAVPWRRYSDNEVNDSIVDTLTMEVPAGETKTFSAEFGYNAETHELLECGLKLDGATEPTLIQAREG